MPPSARTNAKNTARSRHELVYAATAANGAQHDQAIGENAGEDPERDLCDAAAHEVPQDARGVLARSQRQCHQGHGERDAHNGHHRTGKRGQHLARAVRPGPNSRGHWASHRSLPVESASINATAKTILTTTISEGMNQKLDRRLLQSCLNLCMGQLPGVRVKKARVREDFLLIYTR